ncbi:signal peptidase I [Microbacterium maritypicum]|uniref:signal peptidase I n=1 Tax=Microbacterium maritypicum TaxID=33918 RepID=UPI0035576505
MATIARGARAVGRGVREVLLTLAAIGGVICIVLVIMAFTGGYSLIMFKTGSMAPTIPAGSVALVQKIPASDIAVGDVVTVDRDAALPITHRVTGVEPADAGDMRTLTMKGDANDVEDPAPYIVSDVRIVRGSVPALANVIVWFGSPWVLGGVTLGASLLVVWAFWPRRERMAPEESSDDVEEPAAPEALVAAGARRRDRRP